MHAMKKIKLQGLALRHGRQKQRTFNGNMLFSACHDIRNKSYFTSPI